MRLPAIIVLLGICNIFQSQAQILSNGSFENGLSFSWNHGYTSGTASFGLESSQVRDGMQGLRVEVLQAGSSSTAISSENASFANTGESIYLVRFWAKSSVDATDLTVAIEGGGQSEQVHYKIRNHWVLYHLPFETYESALTLKFYYQDAATYYIDGVEILDQGNGTIDVYSTFKWNEKYAPGWGWTAGDNDISIHLPDGRVAWFFNDSFYGYNDPTDNEFHNSAARFLRNAMVVEETDGTLHSRYSGSQSTAEVYFEVVDESPLPEHPENFYWVGDAILDEGKLKVYLVELVNANGGAQATERSYIAEFSYPGLQLEGIYKQPAYAYGYEAFFQDGNYIYLYRTETEGIWGRYTHVARTAKGNLLGQNGPWEFYDGTNWVTDPLVSARVNQAGAESFVKLQEGNYAQISMPNLSREIKASFAPSPEGPWTTAQLIYTIPEDEQYWWYLPNIHQRLDNGNYSVSYSVNSWEEWPEAWHDKYWYRQRYIQMDLMGLSPYTTNDCAGVFGGSAYFDDCGRCVGTTTGLSPCAPVGPNLAFNKPVATSSVYGTNSGVLAVDGSPTTRWESGYSDPQWLYVDLEKNYDIEGVKITWEGAYGEDYLLQTSHDASNWTTIKTITGNTALINDHTGLSGSGRYIRIYGTKRGTMWGYSIYELEVNGHLSGGTSQGITDFGGTITAQYDDSPLNEGLNNLIDNAAGTKYLTFHNAGWVQFQASADYIVSGYEIISANDFPERDPLSWVLQGSDNGTTWVTIDSRSGEDFTERFQPRTFSFTGTNAYAYYRFNFTNNSGSILQLAEIELFGTPAAQSFILTSETKMITLQERPEWETKIKPTPYPIPFTDEIYIPVSIGVSGAVSFYIYNSDGGEKLAFHRYLNAGSHNISWNGLSKTGEKVAPGLYYVKVISSEGSSIARILKQ